MTGRSEDQDPPLTQEQLAARRSNRRVLVAIFLFVLVLGFTPLVIVLVDKLR